MSVLKLNIHETEIEVEERERGCLKEYLIIYICEYSKRKKTKRVRERER